MIVNVSWMRSMSIIAVVSLFFQNRDVTAETAGKLTGDLRVVGGTDANELPTLAFTTGTTLCAATLIHTEYVTEYIKNYLSMRKHRCSQSLYVFLFWLKYIGNLCTLCRHIHFKRGLSWRNYFRWQRIYIF